MLIWTHCFDIVREQRLFRTPDYCSVLDLVLLGPLKYQRYKPHCSYLMIYYTEGITSKQQEQKQSCDKHLVSHLFAPKLAQFSH